MSGLRERLLAAPVTKWLDFGAERHFVNPDGPDAVATLDAMAEALARFVAVMDADTFAEGDTPSELYELATTALAKYREVKP